MENTLQITMRLKDEATEQLKRAVNNVNQSFNEAQKSTSIFGTALADIGKIAAGIGIYKLAESVISYTKATIQAGIETSKFYENAKIGLTTLLGDGDKAVKLLQDIQKTAMATPFDASTLVKANQLLIAAGENAKDSQKIILDLGNAILATGGGNDELIRMAVNLQQIKNIGKATALDIKQFAFAGIPIYQMLAKSMGTTVEKVKDMEISYEMLTTALAKARQEGGMFYQGIENASGSLTQLQSNFKETIQTTTASILEQSGVIDLYKNVLSTATNFLIQHKDEILGVINAIVSWISQHQTLITGIMIFIGILGGLAITLGIVAGILTILSGLFTLLMSPIVLIGIAIAGLITIFILFKDQIIMILNELYLFISGIFNQIWGVISYILNTIFTLFQFIFLSIKTLVEIIMTAISVFILTIMNSIKGVVNVILTAIFGDFNSKFNQIKNIIITIFSQAYNWFKSKLDTFANMVDSVTSRVLGFFKRMADGITSVLRSIKFPHLSIGEGSITIMGKEIKYPKLNVDWYEQGGWVRNTGLAMLHAGEYVLSRDMLAGRQPIGAPVYNYSNSYAPVVNAVINTPIDLDYLAYKLSWQLRNG